MGFMNKILREGAKKAFEGVVMGVVVPKAIKIATDPEAREDAKEKVKEGFTTAKAVGSLAVDTVKSKFKKNDGPQ